MHRRAYMILLSVGASLAIAGCNGPTKAGIQARKDARERITQFSAKFVYDQALHEYETGQLEQALGSVSKAIEANPENAEAFVLLGRVHLEMHKLDKALLAFETAWDIDPELADAHYFAGIVHQRLTDDENALDSYGTAFELESDNPQFLLATAETLIALQRYEEARAMVEDNMTRFEYNGAMRHLLGQITLYEGDPVEAASIYEEASMLDPENMSLVEELAWVQYEAGMHSGCLASLRQINEANDTGVERADLVHLEARCLTLLDRTTEAHRRYLELTRMAPENASAWIEFGTLAWKLGDYRRVAQCSVRAINTAPERFEGYMLQGLYERHEGRLEKAIDLFRKASERSSESILPHLLLGKALEQNGEMHGAADAYTSALELSPGHNDAIALLQGLAESIATGEDGRPEID